LNFSAENNVPKLARDAEADGAKLEMVLHVVKFHVAVVLVFHVKLVE
jgi:hypothetical protein